MLFLAEYHLFYRLAARAVLAVNGVVVNERRIDAVMPRKILHGLQFLSALQRQRHGRMPQRVGAQAVAVVSGVNQGFLDDLADTPR